MDPVEAGDWLGGRPQQLIFLTGLDPNNKESHSALVSTFGALETNFSFMEIGELLALLSNPDGGILRRDWPSKYLERAPALIVLFLDLDWDHSSWNEKKTEAESKCASLRSSAGHASRLAVVLLQQRSVPTSGDDPLATERAHELCQICHLTPRQLFVVPMLGDLTGYVSKLESAFHELAQGFYQQKLKTIRARSIPNNSPALVVRQLFKLAFISELRQDTHTAYRNYRLAYEHCKDHMESWDAVDIFEWRSVVGLLNYKICELCFLHNMAVEAINQMRRHQAVFFAGPTGVYPTPQLANIELQLWNAKQIVRHSFSLQCWHFAQLFEQAVVNGNPVTKPYPVPDPMANNTVFFGQRPWRVGYDGLAPPNVEEDAVTAILHRLVVNYEGVISLLNAAMAQFKKYGCFRMYRKGIIEDYVWCCVQLMLNSPVAEDGVRAVLQCQPPPPPFSQNDVTPAQAAFLENDAVRLDAKVPVRICLRSSAVHPISLSAVVVGCDVERRRRTAAAVADVAPLIQASRQSITLEPQKKTAVIVMLDLSTAQIQKGQTIWITRVCLELGDRHSKMFGQLEYNFDHTPSLQSQRPRSEFGCSSLKVTAADGELVANAATTRVNCLVAEIAAATLELKNTCNCRVESVRLDFKRNEQQTTEAIAVLFVDENDELRSELTIVGAQCVESGETGLPLASILNHSEHVIKADVTANANIIITHVEWLLADVISPIGEQLCAKFTEDYLQEGEVISYCCAVTINASEDDMETPLGRLAIEWKR
ncbi:hypothetical protein TELCIR_01278 [Teladorsagia circumcincta]|uniref:Trafficking protein particle complex subunit 11 domain-containing protein n=1 Tax=Teladorsagia circumcincta TaxID=45464 RepID=A0A2G9V3T7_TELCI|nr:hypothetical protein TELCIR_01278 [Teladorsagia circumcincta]